MRVSATLALLVAGAAYGADPWNGFHDLRAGYTFVERSYDATVDDGVTSDDVEEQWDENHRVFAAYIGSFGGTPLGGLAFGADLAVDVRDTDSDDAEAELEYRWYGAHVYLGWALPIGRVAQVELLPFLGAGSAELERTLPGGTSTSDEETLIEFGAVLNGILTFERFQVGAQVGWLITDARFRLNDAIDEREYDFEQGDFMGSLMLGFRVF